MCDSNRDLFHGERLQLLDQVSPPIQVVRGYVRDEQTTLEISKKFMTVTDETSVVMDGDGKPVVTVKGPAFWMNHFKTIYDGSGTIPLFKMRNKKASLQRLFICEDEQGTELFRIQRKFKWLHVILHAIIPSPDGEGETTLELADKARFGFSAEIREVGSGAVVATLAHSFWKKDLVLKNKEAYVVNVAAGVDLSVIAALCFAWDQAKEDDRHASSPGGGH
ncbi:hypothetical protein CcaverHIS002_0207110 [Cutaneotrichosporon cavernicola]|uniref:DUF567-domain-containing protein n=1 Tax=Cutaneotrichosporon cavernicola TaxID=279322 RepID=A0AA48L2L0_9TREE|nr:uncharacterized protein CcaverHIS019_0207100 [Cutaneotrichosporon cavernicola]BEI81551.1 hypothetical protein CcaverHIS002_0207110 [Cutaneotrichosporon cavernicola]BEI89348.1 hypothetical protein CcaverHIS019_0207100 [Cutaneotrichosporon cavernicola]BEI97123.1 hypothetical protein CcaverHIS631_0207120 [Cutaneotrichosporon cavernicola]BEJ04896.1 hypothetical protein CcaverHIS641_0207130 [Cutaneotrichosporon cavernicola]